MSPIVDTGLLLLGASFLLLTETAFAAQPNMAPTCPFVQTAIAHGVANDGCRQAPLGAPQYPDLLERYGSARPPFDVPGVDYYVGVPSNIVLKDPTARGALPSCATYEASKHAILIEKGTSCTLDGFDFTKGGGLGVQIPAGVVSTTITNSQFGLTGNPAVSTGWIDRRGGDFTLTNSTLEGPRGTPYFDVYTNGNVDIEYNYFHDLDEHGLNFVGTNTTVNISHNAFVQYGMRAGSHPDPFLLMGAIYTNSHTSFNMIYEPAGVGLKVGGPGLAANQMLRNHYGKGPLTLTPIYVGGYRMDHNVVLATDPKVKTISYGFTAIGTGPDTEIVDNYFDSAGTFGPVYPAKGNPTCLGNIALTSGSEYNGVKGEGKYTAGRVIAGTWGSVTCK
jgi:hypothetical protein